MATDTPIGTRIRKRRQILGLTQDQLAGRVGVDRTAVSNWERGRHFPQRFLGRVEDVLGVSLDEDEPRVLPAQVRREIAAFLPGDEETRERAIALLEGRLTWPGEARAPEPPREADAGPAPASGSAAPGTPAQRASSGTSAPG